MLKKIKKYWKNLKKEINNCKGVIRTGEFSTFSNCILQIGVNFKE
ncbi:MAG: RbsD/FucU domain-containing protein [Clostridium sp.]